MKLIVGLGNPGRGYDGNRHNIGFICLNHFARTNGIRFDKKQCQARTGTGEAAGSQIVLARPQTYMNLSGESVSRLINKFHTNLDDLLIIHDDLDLPLDKIRIRHGGSSGGHKGVDSIINCLDSRDFPRLRIGVGRPSTESTSEMEEADIISYVLSDFTAGEKQIMSRVIPRASEAVMCFLAEGLTAAMQKYN